MNLFAECLQRSHAAADWSGWESLYRNAFPTFAAMIDHRHNGEHQLAGIDRSIVLSNSKQLLIDEKVRGRNQRTGRVYEDILLEIYSDKKRKAPGWAVKQLRADYIAYLIAPIGRCYLLPVIQLQSAWAKHGAAWTQMYGTREAENTSWTTVNVPVPPEMLFPAMGGCLRLSFEPFEVNQ